MKAKRKIKNIFLIFVTVCLLSAISVSIYAQDAIEFYKDKVLELYCPYSVGGGFDLCIRTLGKYIPEYLPVKAAIVRTLTGGGGITGTNHLYNAPNDGLTIGIVNGTGMALNQIMEVEGALFDLTKLVWIGKISSDAHLIGVGANSRFKSFDELAKSSDNVVFAATGKGSDDYIAAEIVAEVFGFSLKQISGFEGSTEANLAVVAGEVDGTMSTRAAQKVLLDSGDMVPLLTIDLVRPADLPDVPLAIEIAPEAGKEKLQAITNVFNIEKIVAAPAGTPQDRVELLRDIFLKIVQREDFVREVQDFGGYRVVPLEGEKLQELVEDS